MKNNNFSILCIPGIPSRPVGGFFSSVIASEAWQSPTDTTELSGARLQRVTPKPKDSKLRTQYPFLSSPSCPPELKILTANKITAYHNYCTAHKHLFDCTSVDEQFTTVKQLVENFIENRQIFEEFEFYKQHGRVLGEHPVFKEYHLIRKLRSLSNIELYKTKKNLEHAIWRIEKQIATGEKPELLIHREKSLQFKKNQLNEINRLMPD